MSTVARADAMMPTVPQKIELPSDARPKRKSRWKRTVILSVVLPVVYLLLTGPLLWSTTVIGSGGWKKVVGVILTPIVAIDEWTFQTRLRDLGYESANRAQSKVDAFDELSGCDAPAWIATAYGYWGLFGDSTRDAYFHYSDAWWTERTKSLIGGGVLP